MDVSSPYPANLCSLSCGAEFAGFGKDLGQPIGELIEAMSERAVRERATEHLDNVLGEEKRIDDAFQTGARRNSWRLRLRCQMPGVRAGQVELTLQVIAGDQDVLHRHLRLDMAEERHQRRQAYACANHFTGVCMSKLVRNDAVGNADGDRDIGQVGAQSFYQSLLAAVARQQPAVRERVERAEEA